MICFSQVLDQELLQLGEAAVAAAMGVMSSGGSSTAAAAAAESAVQEAEQKLASGVADGPVEVDEFGRSVNGLRKQQAQSRAALRRAVVAAETRQLQQLAAAGAAAAITVDATEADAAAAGDAGEAGSSYDTRRQEIVDAASSVFADAGEEFADLAAVKDRLESFKAAHPREYQTTYLSMSVPALFAPYVRLQLLKWDPLFGAAGDASAQPSFDKQAWHEQLFDYGMKNEAGGGEAEEEPDADVVPQLVKKLITPLVAHLVSNCWQVGDRQQSQAVATMVGDLLVYVSPDTPAVQGIIDSVRKQLEAAAAATTVPPWPSVVVAVSPVAEAVLSRRMRAALRMMHAVAAFEGLLPRGLLVTLSLGQLAGQLLPYLRSALSQLPVAVARTEAVVGALPAAWFASGSLREATALLDVVSALSRSLEAQRSAAPAAQAGAAHVQLAHRIAAMFVKLGEPERGKQLLRLTA